MAIILITGCSSGFGLLTAARLAARGHAVYATMRDPGKKERLIEEVASRGGGVRVEWLDVTDDGSIRAVVEDIERREGALHVLINNAGYAIGGFFEDLSEKEIRDQFETNFFGTLKVVRATLPLLRKTANAADGKGKVKIINVSSVQGLAAFPGMGAYAASKHAMEGFSESLFHELRPFGIQVVSVSPGPFKTRIFGENRRLAEKMREGRGPHATMAAGILSRIEEMFEKGRGFGDPEEVAGLLSRIVESPRPRFRYVVGRSAKIRLLLMRCLPYRLYAYLLSRALYPDPEER